MNLYESINNNLKESNKVDYRKLPDDLAEELFNNESVTFYVCDKCGNIFKEPDSKTVNAEGYYGVASMFPDSHSMSLSVCPNCGDEDIEEQTLYLDSIVEDFIDNNGELIYNIFSERYPEKINSDTIPEEEYPDECYEIAKDLLETRDEDLAKLKEKYDIK